MSSLQSILDSLTPRAREIYDECMRVRDGQLIFLHDTQSFSVGLQQLSEDGWTAEDGAHWYGAMLATALDKLISSKEEVPPDRPAEGERCGLCGADWTGTL